MDDKQNSKKYFDGHSSTFVNRNGYWNHDYRLTSRILKKRNVKKLIDIKTPTLIQFNYSTAAYLQAG